MNEVKTDCRVRSERQHRRETDTDTLSRSARPEGACITGYPDGYIFSDCCLCPRGCHADRRAGNTGFCGQTDRVRAARAALHYWEEPCLSGDAGSGAVFFSGCTLRCVYCQNGTISDGSVGKEISTERLAEIFLELEEQGAWNINLVTAGHFAPQAAKALVLAKQQGLKLPIVYNSSGYESIYTLKQLDGLIDIYLPDLKYLDEELSARYSAARDYPEAAKAAIAEMVRQTGMPEFDGDRMLRGVIVRHLVLPEHVGEAKRVIQYLYETYRDQIYISILHQYTPMPGIEKTFPELGRRVTKREYNAVVDYAIDLGVECGFVQEEEAAKESFIPPFDITGV